MSIHSAESHSWLTRLNIISQTTPNSMSIL